MELPRNARVLDLGCGQGRLTGKLGRLFAEGTVVGCDLSKGAIAQARGYEAETPNVEFRQQSISDCLREFDDRSIDAILLIEVTFFYPSWRDSLPRMIAMLKPSGLLIVSFRSQYFDALCLAKGRCWDEVELLLHKRAGPLFMSATEFTWQTSREIRTLLVDELGLELLILNGIGGCSGLPGDPHESICRPSDLTEPEQLRLMELELAVGHTVPDGGRYILAIARKPLAPHL
jgi:SAM-dependent methyltransferase